MQAGSNKDIRPTIEKTEQNWNTKLTKSYICLKPKNVLKNNKNNASQTVQK